MASSLPRFGYVRMPRHVLTSLMTEALNISRSAMNDLFGPNVPLDGVAAMRTLLRLRGSAYPLLHGPALRPQGEYVLLDVFAATNLLHRMIIVPRQVGGDAVNAVATDFELAVQLAIDESRWRPDAGIRDLRGRKLQVDGVSRLEIDALGQLGTTLLVVSCKNFPHTAQYDSGEYAKVRNVRSDLERALAELDAQLMTIRESPVGDNYSFADIETVIGLVVTPHVMYTDSERSRLQVSELLPTSCVSSAGELIRALEP